MNFEDEYVDLTPQGPCCTAESIALAAAERPSLGRPRIMEHKKCGTRWYWHSAPDHGHDIEPGDPPSRPYWSTLQ